MKTLRGLIKYAHNTYDGRTQKDTVRRYIVWFRRWRRTSVCMTPNYGACWVRAHTFVIDDEGTSIVNAFDSGNARLGKITFLRTWPSRQLTTDLHANYYQQQDRVEQHLTICHQPGHGYHIYITSIDWLNSLYWLLDLTRTYFNSLSDPDTLTRRAT